MKRLSVIIISIMLLSSCAGLLTRSGAEHEFERGLALFQQGEFEKATPHFEKATELDPDFFKPYLYLGRSYLHLRRWRDALHPLRTAYQLSPGDTQKEIFNIFFDALMGAAHSARDKGNFSEALEFLKEGVSFAPDSVKVRNELLSTLITYGHQLFIAGDFDNALSAFSDAVALSPEDPDALIGLARALLKKGKNIEAARAIQKALHMDSANQSTDNIFQEIIEGQ